MIWWLKPMSLMGSFFRQPKAYPVYTGEYKIYLEQIKAYLSGISNLQTTGRNGLHMYNNQDHSMLTAMLAVKNILGEQNDIWAVNTERSYHEEVKLSRTAADFQEARPGSTDPGFRF